MPDRGRYTVVLALAGYNLVQNLRLPSWAYVPANLMAGAALVAVGRRYGCSWDQMGLDPSRIRNGLKLGLVGVAGAAAAGAAMTSNKSGRRLLLDQRAIDQRGGEIAFRSLIRFPLGTALFEEIAFRGVLYGIWKQGGSSAGEAAAATALAFGAWHLIPTRDALTGNPLDTRVTTPAARAGLVAAGAVLTGLSSLGLSWMRDRSRSLAAPWLAHAAVNSAGYLLGVDAWRRFAAEPRYE